jgi:peptidyl-prolyl cis-trans isomerase D
LQGTNSNVIALDPNHLIVLRIKQHKPAVLLPFSEVQKVIVEKLKRETAQKESQAMGEKIILQLNQGKSPEQVAAQEKLTWKTANSIGRYGEQAPSALIKLVFKMPRPKAGKFAVSGFKTPTGDYAVLVLNAVHDGDSVKSTNGERRVYREELENNFGQLDYSLYAHGLLNSANIVKPQPKSKIDLK